MFRSLHVSLLLIALGVLGLAVLPVLPRTETISTELRLAEVESTGMLLGEHSPELRAPTESARPAGGKAASGTLTLTVPRLGLKDVAVPTGSNQTQLDRQGIMRLEGTGVPWQEGSNTFIVGHALGFSWTRVPYAFYKLGKMQPGDEIIVKDPTGERYVFRVFDRMTVQPTDYWVTYPEEGQTIISLQTCTPVPTFENRLVVRGELIS